MLNNIFFINIVRFLVLVLTQVLLLNHVDFLGYINPYIYILFIIVYPITGNKSLLIFISFLLGLTIDVFSDTGGIHAGAAVFIAYLRPFILKYSFGISYQYNTVKVSNAEFGQRLLYVVSMVFIHHLVLFLLEIFNVNHILLILKSTLFSGIFSTILILSAITIFSKKSK
ncbi:MAG: rod shape-determining protein MreD [Flavobacteriaceae bacterium]|nr:rod shape-determining protein MreD [Flavobacteriaceae bacterium]